MSDLYSDPAQILENEQERDRINERNKRIRETGCYACLHSQFNKFKERSYCELVESDFIEKNNYPDMTCINDQPNYCAEWRAKRGWRD